MSRAICSGKQGRLEQRVGARSLSGAAQQVKRHTARIFQHRECVAQSTKSVVVDSVTRAPVIYDDGLFSVVVPTSEALQSIAFSMQPTKSGNIIYVAKVDEYSTAYAEGVRAGAVLRGVSDPVRDDEVWSLNERASLSRVMQTMRLRRADTIILILEAPARAPVQPSERDTTATTAQRSAPPADATQAASMLDLLDAVTSGDEDDYASGDNGNGTTVLRGTPAEVSVPLTRLERVAANTPPGTAAETKAEVLQQALQSQQTQVDKAKQRQQRRKDYMEQVGQRNDTPFFLIMFASFVAPSLIILAIAYFSGYLEFLDRLYG